MSRTFGHTNKHYRGIFNGRRLPGYESRCKRMRILTARLERRADKVLCRDLGEDDTWTSLDSELEHRWDDMLDWGYSMESWGPNPIPMKDFWDYGDMEAGWNRFELEQYNRSFDNDKDSLYKRCTQSLRSLKNASWGHLSLHWGHARTRDVTGVTLAEQLVRYARLQTCGPNRG